MGQREKESQEVELKYIDINNVNIKFYYVEKSLLERSWIWAAFAIIKTLDLFPCGQKKIESLSFSVSSGFLSAWAGIVL